MEGMEGKGVKKGAASLEPEWGAISAAPKVTLWSRVTGEGCMALVIRARGDRGRGKPGFTLTLLTCAFCVCSPLSEERGPPRSGVSERSVRLPFVLV